jgi:uncharacterized membrane protein
MTQNDYTKALLMHLKGIDDDYKAEILENINEHFDVGLSKGKSEDEIAKALGDPKMQARLFILEQSLEEIKIKRNTKNYFHVISCFLSLGTYGLFAAIVAIFALSFWLLFVLFGIAVIASGIVLLLSVIFKLMSEKPLITVLSSFLAIAFLCLGTLATIWIFNFLKLITRMLLKFEGNLRGKYLSIRSEVD